MFYNILDHFESAYISYFYFYTGESIVLIFSSSFIYILQRLLLSYLRNIFFFTIISFFLQYLINNYRSALSKLFLFFLFSSLFFFFIFFLDTSFHFFELKLFFFFMEIVVSIFSNYLTIAFLLKYIFFFIFLILIFIINIFALNIWYLKLNAQISFFFLIYIFIYWNDPITFYFISILIIYCFYNKLDSHLFLFNLTFLPFFIKENIYFINFDGIKVNLTFLFLFFFINFILIYLLYNDLVSNDIILFLLIYILVYMNTYAFFLMNVFFFSVHWLNDYYIINFHIEYMTTENMFDFHFWSESYIKKNDLSIGIDIMHMKNGNNIIRSSDSSNKIISPDNDSCFFFDKNKIIKNPIASSKLHTNAVGEDVPIMKSKLHVNAVGEDVPVIKSKLHKKTDSLPIIESKLHVKTAGESLANIPVHKHQTHISNYNHIYYLTQMYKNMAFYIPKQNEEARLPVDLFFFKFIGDMIQVWGVEFKHTTVVPDMYKYIYYSLYYSHLKEIHFLHSDESLDWSSINMFKDTHVLNIYKNALTDPIHYKKIRDLFVNNCLDMLSKTYVKLNDDFNIGIHLTKGNCIDGLSNKEIVDLYLIKDHLFILLLEKKFDAHVLNMDFSQLYSENFMQNTCLSLDLKTNILNRRFHENWKGNLPFHSYNICTTKFIGSELPCNGLLPNKFINEKECHYMVNQVYNYFSIEGDISKFPNINNTKALIFFKNILGKF